MNQAIANKCKHCYQNPTECTKAQDVFCITCKVFSCVTCSNIYHADHFRKFINIIENDFDKRDTLDKFDKNNINEYETIINIDNMWEKQKNVIKDYTDKKYIIIKNIVTSCTDIIKDLQVGINNEKKYLETFFKHKLELEKKSILHDLRNKMKIDSLNRDNKKFIKDKLDYLERDFNYITTNLLTTDKFEDNSEIIKIKLEKILNEVNEKKYIKASRINEIECYSDDDNYGSVHTKALNSSKIGTSSLMNGHTSFNNISSKSTNKVLSKDMRETLEKRTTRDSRDTRETRSTRSFKDTKEIRLSPTPSEDYAIEEFQSKYIDKKKVNNSNGIHGTSNANNRRKKPVGKTITTNNDLNNKQIYNHEEYIGDSNFNEMNQNENNQIEPTDQMEPTDHNEPTDQINKISQINQIDQIDQFNIKQQEKSIKTQTSKMTANKKPTNKSVILNDDNVNDISFEEVLENYDRIDSNTVHKTQNNIKDSKDLKEFNKTTETVIDFESDINKVKTLEPTDENTHYDFEDEKQDEFLGRKRHLDRQLKQQNSNNINNNLKHLNDQNDQTLNDQTNIENQNYDNTYYSDDEEAFDVENTIISNLDYNDHLYKPAFCKKGPTNILFSIKRHRKIDGAKRKFYINYRFLLQEDNPINRKKIYDMIINKQRENPGLLRDITKSETKYIKFMGDKMVLISKEKFDKFKADLS